MVNYRFLSTFIFLSSIPSGAAQSIDVAERDRLLYEARSSYESNLKSFDRGRFEFTVRNLNSMNDPDNKIPPDLKTQNGQGFYAFDHNQWHFRLSYPVDEMRKYTSRKSVNGHFKTTRSIFPVDIVSDGKILVEHIERYSPDLDEIRHDYQIRDGGIEESGLPVHFPLKLGLPSARTQGLLGDLDRVKLNQGVTINSIETVIDGDQELIRIKLISSNQFTRTYDIDANRGGIPLRIVDESSVPTNSQITNETVYSDIREYRGKGWFPHRMINRIAGQAEINVSILKADFEPTLTTVDFSIRSDKPIRIHDPQAENEGTPRKSWSISEIRSVRNRYPKKIRSEDITTLEPLPGPIPAPKYGKPLMISLFALPLVLGFIAWVLRSRISIRSNPKRSGFTLIETLVVILVIGILAALILPAIQSARESARRSMCTDRMKQIGLALSQYESHYQAFPGTTYAYNSLEGRHHAKYSVNTHLLPYLEMKSLFDSINFSLHENATPGLSANRTAMLVSVFTFLCPSDPGPPVIGFGRSNLRFCSGPSADSLARDTYFRSGAFGIIGCTTPGSVTDGLSNTVAISERVQGSWNLGRISRFADYKGTHVEIYADRIYDIQRAYDFCRSLPDSTDFETRSGESWMLTGLHSTSYNHVFVPNAAESDCSYLGAQEERLDARFFTEGAFSARSYHPNGVNVGFLDGHVRFVRSGIDLAVWRALSTRNQGEVIPADSY